MALKVEKTSNDQTDICSLTIDEDMTIYTVNDLKNEISKVLDNHNRFELNLAAVEEIDSAGIQLLLGLSRELMRQKKELTLSTVNGSVNNLIQSYGLVKRFNVGGVI